MSFYLYPLSRCPLCASSHQLYVQILGYNLFSVVSLQLVKFFMVSSVSISVNSPLVLLSTNISPPATLESLDIETPRTWVQANKRPSKCIYKSLALHGFSTHFTGFLLRTLWEGHDGHCCNSSHTLLAIGIRIPSYTPDSCCVFLWPVQ